jgi:DNA mismatch repair protein MutS2
MKFFPESAQQQLEFDKIKNLLAGYCQTSYGQHKAAGLRIHTRKEYIEKELRQSHEFKLLLQQAVYFPQDYILNLAGELKLLAIPGAVLSGEQLLQIRKLAESLEKIFRWFDAERRSAYSGLAQVIADTYYEKAIIQLIDDVIDAAGQVLDHASDALRSIRMNLYRKRMELRKVFDRVLSRLNKQGYLAEIEESFSNGRRVVAVLAEQKRTVKGILHGESESRRTSFIEPEETIELTKSLTWKMKKEKKCTGYCVN